MSIHPTNEAERARASHAQRAKPMSRTARRGEIAIAVSYAAASIALAPLAGAGRGLSPATAALHVIGIAVASQVPFEIGAGFTVPSQAMLVPLLLPATPSPLPVLT